MRRRTAFGVLAIALLTSACIDDDDPPVDAGAGFTTTTVPLPDDPNCPADLADPLHAWGEAGFSGVVAISTGGTFDCRYATTPADTGIDTVFNIGSVSKAFTAAAVLDLVDAGTMALDDRAGALVPGLAGPVADATVEQLLLHTSGLLGTHAGDADPITRDEAVAAISGLELAFPSGTDYLYSNAGYTLLAIIVESTSGTTHQAFVREHVLTAGDFTTQHWAVAGNGDLAMTVPELAAWAHDLFTGDLGPQIRDLTFDHGDGTTEVPGWVAFDDDLFGAPFLGAAGGGGDNLDNAAVVYLPDTDQVIALTSDTDGIRAEDLLRAIGPALATGDPIPMPNEPAADIDPEVLEAAAGTYDDGYVVTVDDDGLLIAATTPDAVAALFPRPEGAGDHEEAVLALLQGETAVGRDELALLEDDLGAIEAVDLLGTIVGDGELRTYVTVTTADGEHHLAWYALDERGGIAGVDLTDEPPTMRFVPAAGGRFVPDDPAGTGPDVVVTFDGDAIVVSDDTAAG